MADQKITDLTSKTSIASTDFLAIVDEAGTPTTKNILARDLFLGKGPMIFIASSTATASQKLVADYICDGTADDVQIQAALDSIPDGGHIKLSPGTFNIAAPIVIDILKGLHLEGSGYTSILKPVNSFNDNVIEFSPTSAGIWAKFSNFKIEGNCANQTSGIGIYAPGSLECIFDGLWFHQIYNWGLYLYRISPGDYGHNNKVINCVFDEGDDSNGIGGGIYIEENDENHISFNDFQFMGGAGARANSLADGYAIYDKAGLNTITNNAVVNSYNGIMVRDAGNTIIANNVLDRMRYASVMLRGRQNTVRDNVFYQMGANTGLTNEAVGLWLEYYNSQSVDGNWFISDGTNGVTRSFIKDNSDATGGGDSQFTNNYFFIDGTLGTGILEYGSSKRNYFANNHGNTVAASGQLIKTSHYTVTPLDKIILVDASTGAVTISLPKAEYSYQTVQIKKVDSSGNAVTIDGDGSQTIDGATTQTLSSQYDSYTVASNDVNWYIL